MADMVGAIRAYLEAPNMKPVKYDGEFYPIDAAIMAPVLGPIDVPIVLGAFNEGMLRVAGRVADGIIGHGLFTDRWWNETIDPNLAVGAANADRDPAALRRWGWVITSVDDDDPARAERDARLMIGFYVTVKTYDTLTSLHGWDDGVAAVRNAFRANDIDGMAAAVPQDMLDSIAIYGTTADARDRIAARARLPQLRFHSPPSFMVSPKRRTAVRRSDRRTAERFHLMTDTSDAAYGVLTDESFERSRPRIGVPQCACRTCPTTSRCPRTGCATSPTATATTTRCTATTTTPRAPAGAGRSLRRRSSTRWARTPRRGRCRPRTRRC